MDVQNLKLKFKGAYAFRKRASHKILEEFKF